MSRVCRKCERGKDHGALRVGGGIKWQRRVPPLLERGLEREESLGEMLPLGEMFLQGEVLPLGEIFPLREMMLLGEMFSPG